MFERYILNFENSDTYALLGINPRDKFVSINGTLLREGFFINPLSQIELTIPRDSKLTDEILKLNPIVKPYDDFRTYLSLYSLFNRFDFDINDSDGDNNIIDVGDSDTNESDYNN